MAPFGSSGQTPDQSQPNAPSPVPAPGTANLGLCNFIGQPTVFQLCGMQGGAIVTKEVTVPKYSYVWSTGWAAGTDKILTVKTPYFCKTFGPFVTTDVVAIFQAG